MVTTEEDVELDRRLLLSWITGIAVVLMTDRAQVVGGDTSRQGYRGWDGVNMDVGSGGEARRT